MIAQTKRVGRERVSEERKKTWMEEEEEEEPEAPRGDIHNVIAT